jgi:hypothetical protein
MALTVITSTGIANNQSYTFGSANITGNLTVSSVTNLGNLSNIVITGGSSGNVLTTYGNGVLYWGAGGGGSPAANSVYSRSSQTATANQTTFTVAYTPNFLQVYLNGALLNSTDYTATNGTTVVLTDAATANDLVEFITYSLVSTANISTVTLNSTNVTSNIAITAGYSGVSVGPLSIANGVTISIASGQKWVVL